MSGGGAGSGKPRCSLCCAASGLSWFAGADDAFVVVFAGGWVSQTLLGAWLYLLPMNTPGHPDERRRMLAAVEWAGTAQLVALNAGLALLAIAASGHGRSVEATVGAALALAGGVMALIKAWTYPVLARSDPLVRGSLRLWDPTALGP